MKVLESRLQSVAGLFILFTVMFLVLFYVIGGAVFAWAWNIFMPLVWHAAPHIAWWQGVAGSVLFGIQQSIFSPRTTVQK